MVKGADLLVAAHRRSVQGRVHFIKSRPQRFFGRHDVFSPSRLGRAGARKKRRVLLRLAGGWLPPSWPPSGAGLALGPRVSFRLFTPSRVTPHRGGVSSEARWPHAQGWGAVSSMGGCSSGGPGALVGQGPQKASQLTGNGHDHLVGMCASGQQASRALAQPHVGLPAAGLDELGLCFESALEMATDLSRIPIGPGAFAERPTCMRIARFGNGTRPASFARGIFRGNQPQEFHALSGIIAARQVAECGHRGDGHKELHPPQGLQGFDDGR